MAKHPLCSKVEKYPLEVSAHGFPLLLSYGQKKTVLSSFDTLPLLSQKRSPTFTHIETVISEVIQYHNSVLRV